MATMSYCAVENTVSDLNVVLDGIDSCDSIQDWYESLNQYEKPNVSRLADLCQLYLASVKELLKDTNSK